MMNFRKIKDSIIQNVLGPAEAGRFQTIGYQRQTGSVQQAGSGVTNVQVFYSSGDFPKSTRWTGPVSHDITYRVELTVARAATGDLSIINDSGASPGQLSAALAAFQTASELADNSFDDLSEIVFQILMDGRNVDMGLSKGILSSRWIGQIKKDGPVPRGSMVVLTGYMELTLKTSERITGDFAMDCESITTGIKTENDDYTETAVTVETTIGD